MLLDEEENIAPTSEEEVEGEVVEETTVTETTTVASENEEEEEPAPVVVPPKDDKKKRNIIIIIIVIIVIIALVLALIFGLRGCNKEKGDNNNEPDTSEVVDDGMAVPGDGLLEEGDDNDGTSSGNDGTGTGSGSESGDGTGSGSGSESGSGSDEGSGDSGSGSGSGSGEGSGSGDDGSGDDGGFSGNTGDESEGSDEGEKQDEDEKTDEEPEEAKSYPYDEEDTTDYPSLSVYSVLNQYVYYTDERVTLDGATVTGIHGNTLTIQQYYSGSYYNVEVEALSLPEGVEIGKTIDIIGTVTTKYGKRVVLDEARVQVSGSYGFAYYNKIRLIDRKPDTYFYYSGAIFKRQYRIEYEVEKGSSEWKEAFSELDLYRAFKVEWRNWYKATSSYSTGTDRGETYLVVYNDVSEDSKTFYDIFFDGTNSNDMTSVNSKFDASWTGVAADAKTTASQGEVVSDIDSYHWFSCYSKVQLYYDDFYIGFDDFEAKYIQDYDYKINLTNDQNITALLSGFFDDGDEVTVTGIFMEQHGRNITLQEYDTSAGQGGGYCLEVTLDDTQYTDDIPQLSVPYAYLITVKGTVRVHESPTLLDYTTTLEDATIETLNESYGTNGSKTRMYYGTSSINTISNNQYGEYSAAYFHAGVQIYALPSSWDPDEDGDYWFVGRLRYKSGSLTYVTSEYIPVCIHADEQEGEMEFWKAVINGNESEEETKIYKVSYTPVSSVYVTSVVYITDAPTVAPGFTGIEVGEIIMSNFFQVHYFDEEITYQYTYNGSDYEKSDDRYLSMDLNTAVVATFSSNLGVED